MPIPAADAYCLLEVHQALSREPASFFLSEDLARSLRPGCSERSGAQEPPRLQEASAPPWQVGEAPQDPFITVLRRRTTVSPPPGREGSRASVGGLEEEGSRRCPESRPDVLPPRSGRRLA